MPMLKLPSFPMPPTRSLVFVTVVSLLVASNCKCMAQAAQASPPLGGNTSMPAGNNGQARMTGRGLDAGGLVVVPEDFSKLKLGPGFLLNLQVYDMPEISSQLRVDDFGDVSIPLAGKVRVEGLSLPQAQAAIVKKLTDTEVLRHPEVNVDVAQYAGVNVSVLGEVQSPGRIQLLAPHNLPDVLAMVGGETPTAGDTISIRHLADGPNLTQAIHYGRSGNSDGIRNIMVQPGDTVTVLRAGVIYVLGGVNRPGGYVMQEDGKLDVLQALALAYGTALNAAIGSVRVIRKHPDGTLETIPISYRHITAGKDKPLKLQAEDIVYVPISKLKSIMTASVAATTSSALIYTVH
jgi:polysaccharide export outer membrane protein